ncbi:hypothetical protein ACEPAG_3633 [Sanghuangporus baumii]
MSQPATPEIHFNFIVGPLLIGTIVNAFVLGICFLQFLHYFAAGYKDDWKLVTLLIWVTIIDIYQTGLMVALMWYYIIDNFANVTALATGPWTYVSLPIFSTLASVSIQHFVVWRIMRFLKQVWLGCMAGHICCMRPQHDYNPALLPQQEPDGIQEDGFNTDLTLWHNSGGSVACISPLHPGPRFPHYDARKQPSFHVCHTGREIIHTLNARESLRRTMESSVHNSYQLGSHNLTAWITGGRVTEVHINIEQDVQLDQMESIPTFSQSGEEFFSSSPSSLAMDDKRNFM